MVGYSIITVASLRGWGGSYAFRKKFLTPVLVAHFGNDFRVDERTTRTYGMKILVNDVVPGILQKLP